MKITSASDGNVTISLSTDELLILNNALNEVCNAIDVSEFATRMGADLDEARGLLSEIGQTLDRMAQQE